MDGIPEFDRVRVLCVGDLLLDRFVQGSVQRISPESPVPVILLGKATCVPGGAANVARNVAALGAHCSLIGATGPDAAGVELVELLRAGGRITPHVMIDPHRPTIEKTRFVAQGQHLLRADREETGEISPELGRDIVVRVAELLPSHDVLILSDYAKGLLTDAVIAGIIELSRDAGVPVVVDPKSARLARYNGATVVTPNARETAAATGVDLVDEASVELAGQLALERTSIEAVLMTRAERGMTLVARDAAVVHIPASARDVFDVVGAGDTVVAALATCLGAGLSLEDAARIANAAAGIVVGKHGTATATRSELLEELVRLSRAGLSSPMVKVLPEHAAVRQADRWRADGLTIGFTNGCFDILHVGHVQILEYARSQCDRLVVGMNSDASIRRLKGSGRPVNAEMDRAQILGALSFVDAVVPFADDTPLALIEALRPDVLVKGSDYSLDQVVGANAVLARGGRVLLFDLVPGHSTTGLIERMATPGPAARRGSGLTRAGG